jgi:hypothetical protein
MRSLVLLLVVIAGCASLQKRERRPAGHCEFAVANQTPYAVTVRMEVSEASTVEIGALNPGEQLHHQVPCAQGAVYIYAIAMPAQTGASTPHGFIRRWAYLSEGERVMIPLSWP